MPLGDPRGRVCRVRATLGEQDTPFLLKEKKDIIIKGKKWPPHDDQVAV